MRCSALDSFLGLVQKQVPMCRRDPNKMLPCSVEIRNPKEARRPKAEKGPERWPCLRFGFRVSAFGFLSAFGFRISDLKNQGKLLLQLPLLRGDSSLV